MTSRNWLREENALLATDYSYISSSWIIPSHPEPELTIGCLGYGIPEPQKKAPRPPEVPKGLEQLVS